MFETSRTYTFHMDRLLVPMAKGERSRRVLDIAFSLSKIYNSEIIALTIKDESRELTWSDKVRLVTDAYEEGKERNIKVIPRVKTYRTIKDGIVAEANSHNYDAMLVAVHKRSPLSASVFGGIGDYILKNSKIPSAIMSIKNSNFPYRKIMVPLSEQVNTRTAVSFSLRLKKATNSKLVFVDLRKYDRKVTHGFNVLFDNMGQISQIYGDEIEIMKSGSATSISEEVKRVSSKISPDAVVLGVTKKGNNLRLNSNIKSIIKDSVCDQILVKK
ncbi:universal stress protein [Oxyplasma meridianum]|uniref:Universal stress protein n=1 Tax=Oxyplasma meridianum TaxID=3073602 RepID=A0AAX4NG79_9ARCH